MKKFISVYLVLLHLLIVGAGVAIYLMPRTHGLSIEPNELPDDGSGMRTAIGIDREVSVKSPDGRPAVHLAFGESGGVVAVVVPIASDRAAELLVAPPIGGPTLMVRSMDDGAVRWLVSDTDSDGVPDHRIEFGDDRTATYRYVVEARPTKVMETHSEARVHRHFNQSGIEKLRLTFPLEGFDWDSSIAVVYLADDGTIARESVITGDEWANTAWDQVVNSADW